jgi:hypothetical protein
VQVSSACIPFILPRAPYTLYAIIYTLYSLHCTLHTALTVCLLPRVVSRAKIYVVGCFGAVCLAPGFIGHYRHRPTPTPTLTPTPTPTPTL